MIYWDKAYGLCQKWSGDPSATMLTNFKELLNFGYKDILQTFDGEEIEDVRTTSTQTSVRAIKLPPNYIRYHSITATIGSQVHPVIVEESQELFNERLYLNRTSDRPDVAFIRPRFGVGGSELLLDPIPSDTSTTITINYAANARDLGVDQYVTGTITATNASTTITGVGTTFTAAMVGRYLQVNDASGDGNWYRITGFSSTTSITLENKYDGITVSGKAYIIAECFALPEDLHMAPVYYAMWHYYLGYRQDKDEKRSGVWEKQYLSALARAQKNYKRKGMSSVLREKSRAGGWPTYPNNFPTNASGS